MKNRVAKKAHLGLALATAACLGWAPSTARCEDNPDQVLEWNQVFIDTLIVTNTANSSSQRLGAIVHTAIFDAYNGIEKRYEPLFVRKDAPPGASRRAAVIAAAPATSPRARKRRVVSLDPLTFSLPWMRWLGRSLRQAGR